ncbi:MAG: hypothetical protein ABW061_09250, partial [Polyangiaceae bacterium]
TRCSSATNDAAAKERGAHKSAKHVPLASPLGNTCCSGVRMITRATSPGPIPGEPPPAAPQPDPQEPEPAAPVQDPPVHPRDPNDPPAPEQPEPPAPDDPGAPDESIPEGPDPSPLGTAWPRAA